MTEMTPDALFKLLSGMDDDAALPEALFAHIHTAQQACDILSKHFGIAITRLVKYDSEPPSYKIEFDRGLSVRCFADDLLSQTRLRRVVFEATEQVLPTFTRLKWDSLRRFIGAAVEVESTGPDGRPDYQLAEAIRHYLRGKHIEPQPSGNERLPFWQGDALYLFAADLKEWLCVSYANPMSFQTLAGLLRDLGCEPDTVHVAIEGKRSTRAVWRLAPALTADATPPRPISGNTAGHTAGK